MRSSLWLLFFLGGVTAAPVGAQTTSVSPAAWKRDVVYWAGRAGGFSYRWTATDLIATRAATAKPVFSVAQTLKKEFAPSGTDEEDANPNEHYAVSFFPVSVVGTLLSYERDDYWEGGAHPSGNESFVTVDVSKPGKPVRLTDLFPAAQIHRALLNDAVVRRVLKREKIAPPATLDGLVKALTNKQFGGDYDDMYMFPKGLLESFAFHHVENGQVAVRFLLPHGTEIYRFRHTQLGILLPIPARLKSAFTQAATGKSGALMEFLQKTTRDRKSTLVLVE